MSAPHADWTNTQLVEACTGGDDRAWFILVDRYKNLVYSIPLKFGAPAQDVADIFQAVWLDLFNELPNLREPEVLHVWLARVTLRKCYRWRREQQASATDGDWDAELEQYADGAEIAPEQMAGLEREQMLREALDELPPRCRKMIELLFFAQPPMPYAEVAKNLNLAIGSIGFIRGRCLKRLKRALEGKGF